MSDDVVITWPDSSDTAEPEYRDLTREELDTFCGELRGLFVARGLADCTVEIAESAPRKYAVTLRFSRCTATLEVSAGIVADRNASMLNWIYHQFAVAINRSAKENGRDIPTSWGKQ